MPKKSTTESKKLSTMDNVVEIRDKHSVSTKYIVSVKCTDRNDRTQGKYIEMEIMYSGGGITKLYFKDNKEAEDLYNSLIIKMNNGGC